MSRRKYRRRKASDEDEGGTEDGAVGGEGSPTRKKNDEEGEVDDVMKKLEEAKELQKYRKRPMGVSAVGLAFGKKFTEEEKLAPDPFKIKTGGLVDMNEIQPSDLQSSEDDLLQRLQSTFSAETKMKDDETHMMQYIEDEMTKRKGETDEEEGTSTYEANVKALYQLPDRLKAPSKSKKTEEMLSNQMLSGIPEVDLGLDAKFKNIEETEKAKEDLMEELKTKKRGKQRSLAPTNVATNFTLHSLRFFKDKGPHAQIKKPPPESSSKPPPSAFIPVVGENEPELKMAGTVNAQKRKLDPSQLATDDYHYDKYRKRTRHY